MKWLAFLFLVRTVFSAPINPYGNRGISNPSLFEGDMILTPEQRGNIVMGLDVYHTNRQRASIRQGLWPGGILIYDITSDLARNPAAMAAINDGMMEWTSKTCIRFKKRTAEASYVSFTSANDMNNCSANVGRTGVRQYIFLGSNCWSRRVVAHEIGHAVGFFHEQSRPDRDQYVTILYDNIEQRYWYNFDKFDRSRIDSLGTRYDYRSLMHYEAYAFTRNGLPTILTKQPEFQSIIGRVAFLSAIDAQQANLLYKNCAPQAVPGITPLPVNTPLPGITTPEP